MIQSDLRMPSSTKDGVELVIRSKDNKAKVAFMSTYGMLAFGVRSYATIPLHIASDVFFMDNFGIVLQKGSPLLQSFDFA